MSKNKYMAIDLFVWSLIMAILEAVNLLALKRVWGVLTLSIVVVVVIIVMIRWNYFAGIVAALGGFIFCLFCPDKASKIDYIIYMVGNMFVLLNLFWFKLVKKEKFSTEWYWTILFCITAYLLVAIGRGTVASILTKENYFLTVWAHICADALNALIGTIIVLIARTQKGLFEDQISYLKRIAAEEDNNGK